MNKKEKKMLELLDQMNNSQLLVVAATALSVTHYPKWNFTASDEEYRRALEMCDQLTASEDSDTRTAGQLAKEYLKEHYTDFVRQD